MAYYLNYEALCKKLNDNLRSRCLAYGWFDLPGEAYAECVHEVEDFDAVEAIEVVRCGDCDIKSLCRYAPHLGENGFCSRGQKKPTSKTKEVVIRAENDV